MTNNLIVWSGSRVSLAASQGDKESISVTMHKLPQGGGTITTTTAPFELVDGKMIADLTHEAPTVTTRTVYDYWITENFADEPSLIYPDPKNCSGSNCDLPTYTVCVLGENE